MLRNDEHVGFGGLPVHVAVGVHHEDDDRGFLRVAQKVPDGPLEKPPPRLCLHVRPYIHTS